MKSYKCKMVLSGNILEVRKYSQTQYFDIDTSSTARKKGSLSKEEQAKIKKKNDYRALRMIKRLLASNYFVDDTAAKFITLTFKDKIDLKECKKCLNKYHKKLNYHYGYTAKYIAVPELQKRGTIHFHIIYFGLPYIKQAELKKLWTYGTTYIKAIEYGESSFNNLAEYILKSKSISRNRYFTSRNNLKQPIEVRNDYVYNKIQHLVKDTSATYILNYRNDYCEYEIRSFDLSKLDYQQQEYIKKCLRDNCK